MTAAVLETLLNVDDLSEWELRHPGEAHWYNPDSHLVHVSLKCATRPPFEEEAVWIPSEVADALWAYGVAQGVTPRVIGWCGTCATARKEE